MERVVLGQITVIDFIAIILTIDVVLNFIQLVSGSKRAYRARKRAGLLVGKLTSWLRARLPGSEDD